MAKNDTIHVRVDENVKLNAEKTLAMLGLTISEAVNMMLCQVNLDVLKLCWCAVARQLCQSSEDASSAQHDKHAEQRQT